MAQRAGAGENPARTTAANGPWSCRAKDYHREVCCRVTCAGIATVIRAKGISGLVGSHLALVVSNLRVTIGLLDEMTIRTMDLFLDHRTRNE